MAEQKNNKILFVLHLKMYSDQCIGLLSTQPIDCSAYDYPFKLKKTTCLLKPYWTSVDIRKQNKTNKKVFNW